MSHTPPPVHPQHGHEPPAPKKSSTMMILGIVAGALVLLVVICGGVGVVLLMPALSKARDAAREIRAEHEMRMTAMALMIYTTENKEWMPEAREGWADRLTPYLMQDANPSQSRRIGETQVPVIYVPPGTPGEYNPASTIVLHEDPDALPAGEEVLAAFADGSVRKVPREEFRRLMLGRE